MIRIDAMWLAAEPVDMRCGADRLLARVVKVFGSAQAHHGYLFANARGTRVKLLVHDGFGVWCAARRLNAGRFVWVRATPTSSLIPVADRRAIRRAGPRPAVGTAARDEHDHASLKDCKKSIDAASMARCLDAIRACSDVLQALVLAPYRHARRARSSPVEPAGVAA